jgi:Flp pilus assembly protein TadD
MVKFGSSSNLIFRALGVICLLQLIGCASTEKNGALPYDIALLSGVAVFGEPVPPHRLTTQAMLATDATMRAFVRNQINDHHWTSIRFRRLMKALDKAGYFDGGYSADLSQTAQQTFHSKRGNCLSYTSMVIVLARALDLQAHFQVVDIPPEWDSKGGFLIRNNHISASIGGTSYNNDRNKEYTVDFNNITIDESYDRQRVSDRYAVALFQANIGIQQLLNNNSRTAFSYFRGSIESYPHNSDLWSNLGAFYATHKAFEQARQAYSVALHIEPKSKTANSGLARSYTQLGNPEKAASYQAKVRHYRNRNPYYHFGRTRVAYENGEYSQALAAIDRALQLKSRTGKFHFLKGLILEKLGNQIAARKSFRLATRYGGFDVLAQQFEINPEDQVAKTPMH